MLQPCGSPAATSKVLEGGVFPQSRARLKHLNTIRPAKPPAKSFYIAFDSNKNVESAESPQTDAGGGLKQDAEFSQVAAPERETVKSRQSPAFEAPAAERGRPADRSNKRAKGMYFYNKAAGLLKAGKTEAALPFLQKSFYQYSFLPAYQALSRLQHPPRLAPVLWRLCALLYGLFSLFYLGFLLKKSKKKQTGAFLLKGFVLYALGLTALAGLTAFGLQKRAGVLEEVQGFNAPFPESVVLWTAPVGSDLRVLKRQGSWFQVRTLKGRKGWVKAEKLLLTLE